MPPIQTNSNQFKIQNSKHQGGGVKRLFRKVENRSADYDPGHPGTVRRSGSFIYEQFLPTGGTDVKVCACACVEAVVEGGLGGCVCCVCCV